MQKRAALRGICSVVILLIVLCVVFSMTNFSKISSITGMSTEEEVGGSSSSTVYLVMGIVVLLAAILIYQSCSKKNCRMPQ